MNQQASDDWKSTIAEHETAESAHRTYQQRESESAALNRRTLEFIRDGAEPGERHRLLFSAAANLSEFGCPPALTHALLTESALDSGLRPKEVRRQIECGLSANSVYSPNAGGDK